MGDVYIVTKFAAGGDLFHACSLREKQSFSTGSLTWFTEDEAKNIFA